MSMPSALLTRRFVLALSANFVLCTAKFLFVHLPGFFKELGAGEAEIGRLLALGAVASALSGPLFGRIMDERGRRVVILAGGVLFVCALSLYFAIDRISPFAYFVCALDGLSGGMLYLSLFTYGADQVPAERRTEGLALFGASGLLPMSFGAEIGDHILARAGFHALFAVSFVLAVVGVAMCLGLRDAPAARASTEPSRGVFAAAREARLVPVWVVAFGFFFAVSSVFMFFKTFVMSRGLGSVGSFFTVYSVVALALRLGTGWLPDRFGPTRVLLPALAFYLGGMLLLAGATSTGQVLLAAVLCGVGHGYAYPVLFSLVIERSRPQERGSAMAVYTAVDWGAHVVGGPAIGFVIEAAGYPMAFGVLGTLIVAGALGFHVLDRRVRVTGLAAE